MRLKSALAAKMLKSALAVKFLQPVLAALALLTTFAACNDDTSLKPTSGGRPYEVIVEAANRRLQQTADSLLSAPVEALPQDEPLCTVTALPDGAADRLTRYARCVVHIKTDAAAARTKVRYARDVYARPQLIVNVTVRNAAMLQAAAPDLRRLIDGFELDAGARLLLRSRNTAAEKTVRQLFGLTMIVPEELTSEKRGKDFLWMADNGSETVSSICLYTLPGERYNARQLIAARDSVMKKNIPGEAPGMYMQTEKSIPPVAGRLGRRRALRGLWQMEGDAMGGPFTLTALSRNGRTIVAEAFVYAPGKKKRDRMKRLEAALTTIGGRTR